MKKIMTAIVLFQLEVTILNVTVLVVYFKKRNTDRKRVTV